MVRCSSEIQSNALNLSLLYTQK